MTCGLRHQEFRSWRTRTKLTDPRPTKPAIVMLQIHGSPSECYGTCKHAGLADCLGARRNAVAIRVHRHGYAAHELSAEAYRALSPFEQIPAINDEGTVLSESAAMVIYLAKKSGKLIRGNPVGEAQPHSNGEGLVDFS